MKTNWKTHRWISGSASWQMKLTISHPADCRGLHGKPILFKYAREFIMEKAAGRGRLAPTHSFPTLQDSIHIFKCYLSHAVGKEGNGSIYTQLFENNLEMLRDQQQDNRILNKIHVFISYLELHPKCLKGTRWARVL